MASFDVNSLDMDPMPTYDLTDSNRHGTRCAGEVAAEANNSICAVGIAFEASVGGNSLLYSVIIYLAPKMSMSTTRDRDETEFRIHEALYPALLDQLASFPSHR